MDYRKLCYVQNFLKKRTELEEKKTKLLQRYRTDISKELMAEEFTLKLMTGDCYIRVIGVSVEDEDIHIAFEEINTGVTGQFPIEHFKKSVNGELR